MITRRNFLSVTAVAAAAGVLAEPRSALASTVTPRLVAHIGGATVSRDQILQWEARRLQVVAQRIAGNVPGWLIGDLSALLLRPAESIANVAHDRELLAATKLRLGEAEMRSITSLDLLVSNPTAQLTATPGKFAVSRATITSNLGTAAGFVNWFNGRVAHNDVRAMLVACPDHYVIRTPSSRHQEVIEVTGGAVMASRFLINYADNAGLPIPIDPTCMVRAEGWARDDRGTKIGAVRHQFKNNRGGGFTAEVAVAFPALLPPFMISEHRWHLACEFSNWITAYVQS